MCPRCGNLRTSNRCGWCGYDYHTGMATFEDRLKDYRNWHDAIRYRKQLIQEINKRGIQLRRGQEMKIRVLESLLNWTKENLA